MSMPTACRHVQWGRRWHRRVPLTSGLSCHFSTGHTLQQGEEAAHEQVRQGSREPPARLCWPVCVCCILLLPSARTDPVSCCPLQSHPHPLTSSAPWPELPCKGFAEPTKAVNAERAGQANAQHALAQFRVTYFGCTACPPLLLLPALVCCSRRG